MSKDLIAETRFDDLSGAVSLNFHEKEDFKSFAASIAGVDLVKYEPIALRAYFHHETIVTIYALDKENNEKNVKEKGKLLVKKFKVDIALNDLFSKIKQLDFTLVQNNYSLQDFDVVN